MKALNTGLNKDIRKNKLIVDNPMFLKEVKESPVYVFSVWLRDG